MVGDRSTFAPARERLASLTGTMSRWPAYPLAPPMATGQSDAAPRKGPGHAIGMGSAEALWWPPDKIAGRYLGPYLSSQVGEAADVMPAHEHAVPIETRLDVMAPDAQPPVDELSDLRLG
jgi:hypothetical protein